MHITPLALLALAGVIDITLTLLGQSSEYRAGHHSQAREGNPLAEPFLAAGPWIFAAAASAWVVLVVALVRCWKHRLRSSPSPGTPSVERRGC